MKKLLVRMVVVLLALVVVLYLGRNWIARKSVEIGTKRMTGFPLQIGAMDLGIWGGTMEVRDLKLMNPPEFEGGTFVDLPLFRVDYQTMSMLRGSPHVQEIAVNVAQVVIIKNKAGETNATALQKRVSPSKTTAPAAEPSKPVAEKKIPYRVDLMKVHIGTVVIKDYSKAKPSERTMTLNRDVVFQNVSESSSMTALLMKAVLGPVSDVAGGLVKNVGSLTNVAGQAISGAKGTVENASKSLFEGLKKAVPSQK